MGILSFQQLGSQRTTRQVPLTALVQVPLTALVREPTCPRRATLSVLAREVESVPIPIRLRLNDVPQPMQRSPCPTQTHHQRHRAQHCCSIQPILVWVEALKLQVVPVHARNDPRELLAEVELREPSAEVELREPSCQAEESRASAVAVVAVVRQAVVLERQAELSAVRGPQRFVLAHVGLSSAMVATSVVERLSRVAEKQR